VFGARQVDEAAFPGELEAAFAVRECGRDARAAIGDGDHPERLELRRLADRAPGRDDGFGAVR
jgi:hypothetical protein